MSDKLFQQAPADRWWHNVTVGGPFTSSATYALGFYDAAEVLVEQFTADRRNDRLFYPICYNYRHYLELHLKSLILDVEEYCRVRGELGDLGHPAPPDSERDLKEVIGHDLRALLARLEERLSLVSDERVDPAVSKIIAQLHGADPRGETFRYFNPKKTEHLYKEARTYDIDGLRRRMSKVHWHLLGIDGWLDFNYRMAQGLLDDLRDAYSPD